MPSPSLLLGVAAGGALGSLLRFGIGRALPAAAGTIPWATLGINVLGSLALGALAGNALAQPEASPTLRAFVGVGLLGGFTTFSAFSLETITLAQSASPLRAAVYMILSVTLAVAAAALGLALTRA